MTRRFAKISPFCILVWLFCSNIASASEYHGQVTSGGFPLPGATVTVTQGGKKIVTITDIHGLYSFSALADGAATIDVAMSGFAPFKQDVTVAPNAAACICELKQLSLDEVRSALKPIISAPITMAQVRSEPNMTSEPPKPPGGQVVAPAPPPTDEVAQRAEDGLLINGSVNNAASSQYSFAPRFGNTTRGGSRYDFSLNLNLNTSALDARSYSVTGEDTSKPNTGQITSGFAIEGPLMIPHLLHNGPNIFVGYQRTRNSIAITTSGVVPDQTERNGDFSETIYAPTTGLSAACLSAEVTPGAPFAGNVIPSACISNAAKVLLGLYPLPLPNLSAASGYNYQAPLIADTHMDALNSNVSKGIGRQDQITGTFATTSKRGSSTSLLGFVDTTSGLGINSTINWAHTFSRSWRTRLGYKFSRQSSRSTPYWENRANISGEAGITGNDQDPMYWGSPTLSFQGTSGLTQLADAQSFFTRNETNGVTSLVTWNHSNQNISAGFDFRRQQFNYLNEANARGTFSFTGAATAGGVVGEGSDVADFLLGIPDTSSIAYGNADKYLRQSVYAAYLQNDWRVLPQLTVLVGVRWEYGAPVTELKDRLVNLDVAPGFTAVAQVLASNPGGTLTGRIYPRSLVRPDREGVEPKIGISWRPLTASSLLIKGGYGMNYDTSVYQNIALQMAQQAPLSKSLTVENSAVCPLTLTNAFNQCSAATPETFGIDPNFRVGYVHSWNLILQSDLPESMQIVATYLGIKGTRGAQLFLPNTNPAGAVNPCPNCPVGFEYLTSTGNSTHEAGQIQLRRRLHNGFTASVTYTYSKSLDDDSSYGGQGAETQGTLAQDWRNLKGERGLSNFDQRNLLNATAQYSTGMGMGGGTLRNGWRGRLYKDWTVQTIITAGSGLPQTPIDSAVAVAGYSALVRPNLTGAPLYAAPTGLYLNPAAYSIPAAGQWGNARRDSITGPGQVSMSSSMLRTFRIKDKYTLDLSITAANALNHVTYTGWNNFITSSLFGSPVTPANAMRNVTTSLRMRF